MWTLSMLCVCAAGLLQGAAEPARPTPDQAARQDMELGMFIHIAPNTWQDSEGDQRTTPLDRINPAALDTEQRVQVAESMGAKYIVFVAKHVGGFCMWQTDTTDYGIKNTPWKEGKGDMVGDFAKARGIGVRSHVFDPDKSAVTVRGVGIEQPCHQIREHQVAVFRTHIGKGIFSEVGQGA